MRKVSWPFGGDETMAPTGDPSRDMSAVDPLDRGLDTASPGYSTMSPEKHISGDNQTPSMGMDSGAILSPLDDDFLELFENFVNDIDKSSSVMIFGSNDVLLSKRITKEGHSLSIISGGASEGSIRVGAHHKVGNPMFSRFESKLDAAFSCDLIHNKEDAEILLKNIYSQLRPIGAVLVRISSEISPERIILKSGFLIEKKINNAFYIKKSDVRKMATATCYDREGSVLASFECDIAETQTEKSDGLQPYLSLGERAGLLFPYDKPSDVSYHMGSVGFPIDIAFLDKDGVIKKSYNHVLPGSLEVFSCTNVAAVLEVPGGVIRALGGTDKIRHIEISRGERVSEGLFRGASDLDRLGVNRCIFKNSKNLSPGIYKHASNVNICVPGSDSFVTDYVRSYPPNIYTKKVIAFDLDSMIMGQAVPLYKRSLDDTGVIARGLFGETSGVTNDKIKVSLSEYITSDFYKKIDLKYSFNLNKYVNEFVFKKSDRTKLLDLLREASDSIGRSAVIAYRGDKNEAVLSKILELEVRARSGVGNFHLNAEFVRVPSNYGSEDIASAAQDRYSDHEITLYGVDIIKSAGTPVPDSVKNKAKVALRFLERSQGICEKVMSDFEHNLSQYQKAEPEAIASSSSEYSESCRGISAKVKRSLVNIKRSIEILGEIRDISSTSEIISSVADQTKIYSDSAKSIFDLKPEAEDEGFTSKLEVMTNSAEESIENLSTSINRAKDYISRDILGLLILSE